MKITLFLIILFWTVPLLSESYFCDPGSFEQLGIKFKKEIECAKRNKNNQIVFFKLNKKIKKSFTKYTENIKKDKDRYSNNKSAYLQQAMLKNSANKYFHIYFNKDGIAHRAKSFDNGADYFKDGLARIEVDKKIGFINKQGTIVIRPQYEFISPFRNGYAKFCKSCLSVKDGEHTSIESNQWFYINKENNEFSHPIKTLKLPFDESLQKKIFKTNLYQNDKVSRGKLKHECKKNNNACVNYATFILEEKFAFDLGHYQYSLNQMGHSTMISPDEKEISEQGIIKKLSLLCKGNVKICPTQAVAHYLLGQTKVALTMLHKSCQQSNPHGCHYLGTFMDHQLHLAKASKAFKKACTLNVNQACENKLLY